MHDVGQDVFLDDAPVGAADGAGGERVVELADREHLAAKDAGIGEPAEQPQSDEEDKRGGAVGADEDEEEEDLGDGEHNVYEALDEKVDCAAEEAGYCPHHEPDGGADNDGGEADEQRNAAAVENASIQVAPGVVGTEEMVDAGRFADCPDIDLLEIVGGDKRGKDDQQGNHDHVDKAGDGAGVLHEQSDILRGQRGSLGEYLLCSIRRRVGLNAHAGLLLLSFNDAGLWEAECSKVAMELQKRRSRV